MLELLPTPRVSDANGSGRHGDGGPDLRTVVAGQAGADWGDYGPAIQRWEGLVGRPAPSPVSENGRLAPEFVEWMMGLPPGLVTATPGLSRNAKLRALGNGVVPQQGAHALRHLLEQLQEDATMEEITYREPECSGKPGRCEVHGRHREPQEGPGFVRLPLFDLPGEEN